MDLPIRRIAKPYLRRCCAASSCDAGLADPKKCACQAACALAATLERRRFYRTTTEPENGYFANHCPYCGAVQEDYLLHSEPGDVFFCIAEAEPGSIELTAVEGRIRVSGDCGFGV
jgi:hypothetical protein